MVLDPASHVGLLLRPRPYRVVLMDQDVVHRISATNPRSPYQRLSLVWKLIFVPRGTDAVARPSLAREHWGEPWRMPSAHLGEPVTVFPPGPQR